MNKKWLVVFSVVAVGAAFFAGAILFQSSTKQKAVEAAQTNTASLVRPHSPIYGNPEAKVTIVEFFDPSCETCRAFYPFVKSLVNSSFGGVRLVIRYAPLHEGSHTAVKILEAARRQGKYWEVVERALRLQPQWAAHGNPQPELIWDMVADVGLNIEAAKAMSKNPAIEEILRQDMADMRALKVSGTPGFFVNGTPLRDFGQAQLKSLVDEKLAKTKPR